MKKLAILMFSLLMILSACGTSADNNTSQNKSNEEAVDSNASQGESNEEAAEEEANVQQSVGVFKGWADNHTIEVETDNGYVTYYVSPDKQEAVSAVEEGSEVTISFIENEGRMELQSVQAN